MTLNGYIACEVYLGAVNAATYNAFIQNQLIPTLHRIDPDREWIIVMDNASIHRSEVFDRCFCWLIVRTEGSHLRRRYAPWIPSSLFTRLQSYRVFLLCSQTTLEKIRLFIKDRCQRWDWVCQCHHTSGTSCSHSKNSKKSVSTLWI